MKFICNVSYDNSLQFTVSTPAAGALIAYQGSLFNNNYWSQIKKVARAIYRRAWSSVKAVFKTFRTLWNWVRAHPYIATAMILVLFGVIYITRIRKGEDIWTFSEKYALPCNDKRLERGYCGEVTLVDEDGLLFEIKPQTIMY